MKLVKYVRSFRLRTLPLSMSGIILGCGLAAEQVCVNSHFWAVFALAILTTLSLQILSNLSNELGDSLRGTDDEQTARVAYGLQAGEITKKEMQWLIVSFVCLSAIFGSALVYTAFGTLFSAQAIVFLALGLAAIIGAMTYTLGRYNYGYRGFGDIGVFIFFGLVSTLGSFYLQAATMTPEACLAAVAIALPIVGVLNLNNIRDMDNDLKHGKRTFASLMGKKGAKVYHTLLITGCMVLFALLGKYYTLLVLPVLVWHVYYIFTHSEDQLDKQMPVLMFTTIIIAFLACIPC